MVHSSLALQCLICKELRIGLFFFFVVTICSASLLVFLIQVTLLLEFVLVPLLSVHLQIYDFESGTIGADTITLTPHSFHC